MGAIHAGAVSLVAALFVAHSAAAVPLDLGDPNPRLILVEFEISPNLATVGAVFSAPVQAVYAATGGLGTVVIDDAAYETFAGTPGLDIGDVTARIDLATRAAEAIDVEGTVELPPFGP
jgi:hypothetical protein